MARVTGQYSRLGALLDQLTDRLLVLAGVIVCWHFELLWLGRAGVWPVLWALFFAMAGFGWLGRACLYVGLVLVLGSTLQYLRDGLRARGRPSSSR